MALEFQFAFLGPEDQYVATVTTVTSSDTPEGNSASKFLGLPEVFCEQYRARLAAPRYIYNVRGHDFLSYIGQWTSATSIGNGPLPTNSTMYGEIAQLGILADEDQRKSGRKANLIASFGPAPGAFFADAFRLGRYRRVNLPVDLENRIQVILDKKAYSKAKIYDVAINGSGGWVIQFDRGKSFEMGGTIPVDLREALELGRKRNLSINRLFLNHQHPTEYLLLFSDGAAYARLHEDFKVPLRGLLDSWSKSKRQDHEQSLTQILSKMFKGKGQTPDELFNFVVSSSSSLESRRKRTAAYYRRRGTFHQKRGNLDLAHAYIREAKSEDPESVAIQNDYVSILKAKRMSRYDPNFEEHFPHDDQLRPRLSRLQSCELHSPDFVVEYLGAIRKLESDGEERSSRLAKKLREGFNLRVTHSADETQNEWSYAVNEVVGLAEMQDMPPTPRSISSELHIGLRTNVAELPGDGISHG